MDRLRVRRAGHPVCAALLHHATGDEWLPLFDADENGHLAVTERAGLGLDIDWAEVEKGAKEGAKWRDQLMVLADGTKANW